LTIIIASGTKAATSRPIFVVAVDDDDDDDDIVLVFAVAVAAYVAALKVDDETLLRRWLILRDSC